MNDTVKTDVKAIPADAKQFLAGLAQHILGFNSPSLAQAAAAPVAAPVAAPAEVAVVEVAAEVNPEPAKKVEGPLFTILPVANSQGKIVVENNELRRFICEETELYVMTSNCIEQEGDTEQTKRARRNIATKSIRDWYGSLNEMNEITEEDFDGISSLITFQDFRKFVDEIQKFKDIYDENIKKAFDSGTIGFDDLYQYLSSYKDFVQISQFDTRVVGKVVSADLEQSFFGTYIDMTLEVFVRSPEGFSPSKVDVKIGAYKDKKTFEEIGLWKLDTSSAEFQKFVARGERYLDLTEKPAYVQTSGVVTYRTWNGSRKFNADGRFVIDLAGMKRAVSNYGRFYGYENRNSDSRSGAPEFDRSIVTDIQKASCVPFLYGFSMKAKQWGEIHIDQVSEIQFRKDAYDKLVLDKDLKELIFAQVEDKNPQKEADLIDGKGGGVIFLLAGTPGLGKTLTAEAVAERLKRPLYTVSVGELGTNVVSVEENLRDILETAAAWDAILLIDEADIFLEARTADDIERNAMVAVFLRLLEYYQGILFLTTNRADNLDEAFFSRISLAIHYPKLTYANRKNIWHNLLQAAKIPTFSLDVNGLAEHILNGRQIKHVIKTAGALARFKGRNVNHEDFSVILRKQDEFHSYVSKMHDAKVINGDDLVKEVQVTPKKTFWQKLAFWK